MRSLALLAILITCQGCQYRYWVEEERFGVFVEREYMEEHKRTYETGLRYRELCNTVMATCYRSGPELDTNLRYNVLTTGVIAVYSNNRDGEIFDETFFEMYRTADGVRLRCENCTADFERSAGSLAIAEAKPMNVAIGRFPVGDKTVRRIFLLDIGKDSYRLELIEEHEFINDAVSLLYDEAQSFYWIDCRAECQFVKLDIATKEREVRSAPECQGKKKIEVIGKEIGQEPKPRCYNEDHEVW
jgi:hypothetical protein